MTISNDVLKTIEERFSCRAFTSEALTHEELEALAKAAVQAPSGMNKQPWQIIMVTNPSILRDMEMEAMRVISEMEDQSVFQRFQDRGGKIYYDAPCMVVIPILPGGEMDCGIVSENISLAAQSLGLGSVICGMARIPFEGPKGEELKKRMQFAEGYDFGVSVLVGHWSKKAEPHEPDMSKIKYID